MTLWGLFLVSLVYCFACTTKNDASVGRIREADCIIDLQNQLQLFPRRHRSSSTSFSDFTESQGASSTTSVSTNIMSTITDQPTYLKDKDVGGHMQFNDPLFQRQWYLHNRELPGHDINVLPVWREGIKGKGVVIALIDDGVDFEHTDLKDNFRRDLSYDFNNGRLLPIPDAQRRDHHGTRCAGQIAAKADNSVCGVGIAPDAQISAICILAKAVSSRNEAAAVIHRFHENHIYSCSWGPADDGKAIDAPDAMVLRSFIEGLTKGRNGKGSIYVFAAGNGKAVDNCNYDGYASGMFSLTVGAIDRDHRMPSYMEPCAAQLVVSYSSNEQYKIATTDLGANKCTLKHGGTSAAAPMVTGILALALSVNPALTWRDVRYLCVETAIPIRVDDASWVRNGAGKFYSYHFGFGKIDAHKLIGMARIWKPVPRQAVRSLPVKRVNRQVSGGEAVVDEIKLTDAMMIKFKLYDITALEYVTIRFNIEHSSRGDLVIHLCSPSGTTIPLATTRPLDKSSAGLLGITMMTAAFWGEQLFNDNGVWTLRVSNAPHTKSKGTVLDYRLAFWGPLRGDVLETDEEYSRAFLHNYYPPSADFFIDKDGIFSSGEVVAVAAGKEHQQQGSQGKSPISPSRRISLLSLLLCAGILILTIPSCLLVYRYSMRWMRRRRGFSPVPPRFNSSLSSITSTKGSASSLYIVDEIALPNN